MGVSTWQLGMSLTVRGTLIGGDGARSLNEDLSRTSLLLVIRATAPVKSQPVTYRLAGEQFWYCILIILTVNAPQKKEGKTEVNAPQHSIFRPL